MPTAVNKDIVNQIARDFCYKNNKGSRRRLVEALFEVPRNRPDLIPYYARLVATLDAGAQRGVLHKMIILRVIAVCVCVLCIAGTAF